MSKGNHWVTCDLLQLLFAASQHPRELVISEIRHPLVLPGMAGHLVAALGDLPYLLWSMIGRLTLQRRITDDSKGCFYLIFIQKVQYSLCLPIVLDAPLSFTTPGSLCTSLKLVVPVEEQNPTVS